MKTTYNLIIIVTGLMSFSYIAFALVTHFTEVLNNSKFLSM